MPIADEHQKIDKILFGETIPDVHRILDKDRDNLGGHHRVLTHSLEGLERIYKRYGTFGYTLALIHIGLDYGFLDKNLFIKKRRRKGFRFSTTKTN